MDVPSSLDGVHRSALSALYIATFIGFVTFTGSIIAFLKLDGAMGSKVLQPPPTQRQCTLTSSPSNSNPPPPSLSKVLQPPPPPLSNVLQPLTKVLPLSKVFLYFFCCIYVAATDMFNYLPSDAPDLLNVASQKGNKCFRPLKEYFSTTKGKSFGTNHEQLENNLMLYKQSTY